VNLGTLGLPFDRIIYIYVARLKVETIKVLIYEYQNDGYEME
jgi:hypothetical protein